MGAGMNELFKVVEIEVNSNCNRKCSYCPNSRYQRKEKGEMTEETFRKIIEQLEKVHFTGRISYHFYGEPLLCKNLIPFISYTKEKLPETRAVLYSNGDFIDEDMVRRLFDAGIDRMVITNHDGEGSQFALRYQKFPSELMKKVEYLQQEELELTNRGGLLTEVGIEAKMDEICYVPTTLIVITLLGNVLPCFEDYKQKNVMGNILKENLIDIWNKPEYVLFREKLANGERAINSICRVCNNYSVQENMQFDYVL